MKHRFMSIGECLVEIAPREDGSYAKGFAGDTFNTAWYARRVAPAEVDVCYLTAVGSDEASREMVAFMNASGVEPIVSVREGRSVGLYMISLKDGERSFSYWRDTAAARTLADDLDALPGMGAGDMVLFSGISLAVLPDAGRERLLRVLAEARAAGVLVAFDPNLRPRLWQDLDEMRMWITRGAAVADISLPSFEDEAEFFDDVDVQATALRYGQAGADMVIVKDGPNPILVAQNGAEVLVPVAAATEIVDTTAAGDSFNARFLTGLLQKESPEAAAAAASKLSRRVIAARGALVEGATEPTEQSAVAEPA